MFKRLFAPLTNYSPDRAVVTLCIVMSLLFVGYIAYERVPAALETTVAEYPPPVYPVSMVGAPTKGDLAAPVGLIVYSDFICPACGRFALLTLPALEKRYVESGRLQVATRHLPAGGIHSLALRAALAATCADRAGRFWDFYASLFAAQVEHRYGRRAADVLDADVASITSSLGLDRRAFDACLIDDATALAVYADAGSSVALGVSATPTILVGPMQDGKLKVQRFFSGAPDNGVLFAAIDAAFDSRSLPTVESRPSTGR